MVIKKGVRIILLAIDQCFICEWGHKLLMMIIQAIGGLRITRISLLIIVAAHLSVILPAPVSPWRAESPNGVAGFVRETMRSLQCRPRSVPVARISSRSSLRCYIAERNGCLL